MGVSYSASGKRLVQFVAGLEKDISLSLIIPARVFNTVGTVLFMPNVIGWALKRIPRAHYGVASGIFEISRLCGIVISNVAIVFVFALLVGDTVVSTEAIPEILASARFSLPAYLGLSIPAALVVLTVAGRDGRSRGTSRKR